MYIYVNARLHACACGLNIDDLVADVLVDVLLLHACTPNNMNVGLMCM